MREAMVMKQQRHPHVLPLFAAFLHEHYLWMVTPYVAGGSAIHILNKHCPQASHSVQSMQCVDLLMQGMVC